MSDLRSPFLPAEVPAVITETCRNCHDGRVFNIRSGVVTDCPLCTNGRRTRPASSPESGIGIGPESGADEALPVSVVRDLIGLRERLATEKAAHLATQAVLKKVRDVLHDANATPLSSVAQEMAALRENVAGTAALLAESQAEAAALREALGVTLRFLDELVAFITKKSESREAAAEFNRVDPPKVLAATDVGRALLERHAEELKDKHEAYRALYALWLRVARAMTPLGGPDITDEEVAERADALRERLATAERERDGWKLCAEEATGELTQARSQVETLTKAAASALASLNETRWMNGGSGPLSAWERTPEGLNHARVMAAIEALSASKPGGAK